jgi:hypothetical protein
MLSWNMVRRDHWVLRARSSASARAGRSLASGRRVPSCRSGRRARSFRSAPPDRWRACFPSARRRASARSCRRSPSGPYWPGGRGRPSASHPERSRAKPSLNGPGSTPSQPQPAERAPVIMAARSSGRRKDAGGGGAQANRPRAPSRSSGARRVLEIPEEVRARVVAAQSPDVPFGVALERGEGTAPDVVDVVDLPGRVVQEVHRGGQHQDVVVVGGAAHERGHGVGAGRICSWRPASRVLNQPSASGAGRLGSRSAWYAAVWATFGTPIVTESSPCRLTAGPAPRRTGGSSGRCLRCSWSARRRAPASAAGCGPGPPQTACR